MVGKSFKTFIWAESGLSRASENLPEMHRPDHDFGPRRMLADSVAEQGLNNPPPFPIENLDFGLQK